MDWRELCQFDIVDWSFEQTRGSEIHINMYVVVVFLTNWNLLDVKSYRISDL